MAPSRSSKTPARKAKPARSSPAKSSKKPAAKPASKPAAKPPTKKPVAPAKSSTSKKAPADEAPLPIPEARRTDGRRHLLSLSFVRDGDEFLARMETDTGHITELKNRALDQLLTLVAGELEDLLD
jgi:hypothetical protein